MKKYEFVAEGNKSITVEIIGDYRIKSDHDWWVFCPEIDLDVEISEDDGQQVFDLLNERFKLTENQKHFAEEVIVQFMAYRDYKSIDEVIAYQRKWEAEQQSK